MNRPAPDWGGSGRTPVIDELTPLFEEIVELLGQLAGNEHAWQVLDDQRHQSLPEYWRLEPDWFKIPGPHGFELQGVYAFVMPGTDGDPGTITNADRSRLLQELMDTVWNDNHDSWVGSAVPTVYRSASQNVWEPDPGAMSSATDLLCYVTSFLDQQLRPGAGWSLSGSDAPAWLGELRQGWPATSHSSASFYDFWDDVNDKCSLYLHAAARLASTSAQVTATVADFQRNVLEVATRTRDHARTALEQWQQWKQPSGLWPSGEMDDHGTAKTILGGISYGAGVVSLYGPAAVVAGPVSVVTGGLAYLVPDQTVAMEATTAATAHEIHQGFMNDLRTIETNMAQALDKVRSEPPHDASTTADQPFSQLAADVVANRRDWSPPDVRL